MSLDTSQSSWRSRGDYFHQLQLDFQSVPGSAWDFTCVYPRKWGDVLCNEWDHTGVTRLRFCSHGKFVEDIWEHSCLGYMKNRHPSRFFAIASNEIAKTISQVGRCSKYGDNIQNWGWKGYTVIKKSWDRFLALGTCSTMKDRLLRQTNHSCCSFTYKYRKRASFSSNTGHWEDKGIEISEEIQCCDWEGVAPLAW